MLTGKPCGLQLPTTVVDRVDNPFTRAVGAGAFTAAAIAGTTAFAPVGSVGATGWTVVYAVAGATGLLEGGAWIARSAWGRRWMRARSLVELEGYREQGLISEALYTEKLAAVMADFA